MIASNPSTGNSDGERERKSFSLNRETKQASSNFDNRNSENARGSMSHPKRLSIGFLLPSSLSLSLDVSRKPQAPKLGSRMRSCGVRIAQLQSIRLASLGV